MRLIYLIFLLLERLALASRKFPRDEGGPVDQIIQGVGRAGVKFFQNTPFPDIQSPFPAPRTPVPQNPPSAPIPGTVKPGLPNQQIPEDSSSLYSHPPSSTVQLQLESDQGCDSKEFLDVGSKKNCNVATAQLIFPKKWGATAQNLVITQALLKLVGPSVRINDIDGFGIIFWSAKLTWQQIDELKAMPGVGTGIRGIEPNGPTELGAISESDDWSDGWPVNMDRRRKRDRLEKRDNINVRADVYGDTGFVSTPFGEKNNRHEYHHFRRAGKDITVYVVDVGAVLLNDDVADIKVTKWLHAVDALWPQKTDDGYQEGKPGHGTCVLSKVAGKFHGISIEPDIVIVKVGTDRESFLRGYVMIIKDLITRSQYEDIIGRAVVTSQQNFGDIYSDTAESLRKLMDLLQERYQAVLTVSVGNEPVSNRGQMRPERRVPSMFSLDSAVITVGAVSFTRGFTMNWSPDSPARTVSAPGQVECADMNAGDETVIQKGNSFSTPAVAAHAANLLSDPVLRSRFKASGNVPLALKTYIVNEASYVREGADDNAIWNRMYPNQGPPLYGYTPWQNEGT